MARIVGKNHMEIESKWTQSSKLEKMLIPKNFIVMYKISGCEEYILSYEGKEWYITNSEYVSIVDKLSL